MNTAEAGDPLVRVHVWDRVVRSTHWLIALAIAVLAATGVYIGHPFLLAPGAAGGHFIMGTVKVVHFYAAIAFTLAVLSRIAWLFLGKGHARWREFVPVDRERRIGLYHALQFYLFLRRRPDFALGHNPAAGFTYIAVFGLYLVMIATGLGLYAVDASVGSPFRSFAFLLALIGGAQTATWIHHVVMWLLLGFVVHHVYSAVLTSAVEANGELDSIVSGNKWVPASEARRDAEARGRS
jgi:Ni/Fe-hydrogenase 1 B-type cytochrome subunit